MSEESDDFAELEKVIDEETQPPTLESFGDKALLEEVLRRIKAAKVDQSGDQSGTFAPQVGDAVRGENLMMKADLIMKDELLHATLAETTGLLKSKPNIGRMAKELVLVWSEMHNGIEGIVKSMRQPKIPMPLIGFVVIVVALTTLFAVNPEYGRALQQFTQDRQNQVFIVVVMLIAAAIAYLFMRRRNR